MSAGCARAPWLADRVAAIMAGVEERERLISRPGRWKWYLLIGTSIPRRPQRWHRALERKPSDLYAPCGP